jgi:hypothetical protein
MFRRSTCGSAVRTRSAAFLGLLFCAAGAFGEQSLRLAPDFYASTTVPSAAPYAALGSTRFEFRIHNWSRPTAAYAWVVTQTGLTAQLAGDSDTLRIADEIDTFSEGWLKSLSLDISGRTDFVVRAQRDTVNKLWTAEIWNADGSSYQVQSRPIVTVNNRTWGGDLIFPVPWAPFPNLDLAYFRWYEGVVALNSTPPHGSSGGNLGDWEFEGNGNDSSSHHLDLTLHGGAGDYATTPNYAPAAILYSATTVRAGYPAQLDASRSYPFGGGSMSYQWQQLSGPSSVQWSSRSSVTPTITGLTFGTYTFQVTVTDERGLQGSARADVGAVASNDNGVVISGDSSVARLFGPMLRYGGSPWPWADDRHKAMADFFGGLLSTDDGSLDEWNIQLSGTISVQNGSPVVTGSGSQFQTDFCGGAGNTSPAGKSGPTDGAKYQIVVWYPTGASGFGRRDYEVQTCDSQTQITLKSPYSASASASQLKFARWYCLGCWINGSDNRNYYDNVLAHYALYYRTGLTKYRDYARTLADRWWTMPYMDEGRCIATNHCVGAPRIRSLTGLMARALDGRPEMWPGLEAFLDQDATSIASTAPLYDLREQAYQVSGLALGAMFDTNPEKRAAYRATVVNSIANKWAPQQMPGGNWTNPSWGYATWNGSAYTGSASVTNGSVTVAGIGTNWQPDWIPNNYAWFADLDGDNGDPVAYRPTYVSPTEITLDRPYEGATATGRGWQFSNLVGHGTQPFMMGIAGMAWRHAYLATGDARARQFTIDVANWIKNQGYRAATRGLYYGRVFPNCEPISEGLLNCASDSVQDSRFLNPEVYGAISVAYLETGDASLRTLGDVLYGATFGKLGGPETDGVYVTEIEDGGWMFATKKAKDFGSLFGFGGGSTWPSARLGSASPATDTPSSVAFDLQSVPDAAQVRVTVKKPDGSTAQTTCSASACQITVDARQGDHLVRLEYLSPVEKVLATSDWMPLAVR